MTRSRTATSVSSAASLSATAVTTSTMSALPAAAASACASALRPDWATPSTAPWRSAAELAAGGAGAGWLPRLPEPGELGRGVGSGREGSSSASSLLQG